MSEIHRFLMEGMPVRGMLVQLDSDWQNLLARREAGGEPYAAVVQSVLGQMTAAAVLMQANIQFNGALVLQVSGDGPVKLAVVEVQPALSFRATAKVMGDVTAIEAGAQALGALFNPGDTARCALTLDPKDRLPGQQPYQGVVPLVDDAGDNMPSVAAMLESYMARSEQLQTRLILAANGQKACGLLLQKMPIQGAGNLEGLGAGAVSTTLEDDFERLCLLAGTLTDEELLGLDAETVLRRLFWEEPIRLLMPAQGHAGPRFACTCSRERVGHMLLGLGRLEVDEALEEQGVLRVGCEFCGSQQLFDAVDVAQIFSPLATQHAGTRSVN